MRPLLFGQALPSSGYFAVFEGQDGNGKTTIMKAVAQILKNRGLKVKVIPEFSRGPFGKYLLGAVAKDKFLRSKTTHLGILTQVNVLLADWIYSTEHEIMPALQEGMVVLKDRYTDSQIVCQVPTVLEVYEGKSCEFQNWIEKNVSINPIRPNRIFYLNLSEKERVKRIKKRNRTFKEDRANIVSEEDLRVFRMRDNLYFRRMRMNPNNYIIVKNNEPIKVVAEQVASIIWDDLKGSKKIANILNN